MRRGRSVEQVCNRKVTMWYENHTIIFRQSVQSESSRARDTQPIRGVSSSLTIWLARRYKHWHPFAPGRTYRARSSPFEYMYLHLSLKLTTNCVPLSRIKWEWYIFIKKCVLFVHWSLFIIFDNVLCWVYEKYTTLAVMMTCRNMYSDVYSEV